MTKRIKIKHLSELPTWTDYLDCGYSANYGAAEWFWHLDYLLDFRRRLVDSPEKLYADFRDLMEIKNLDVSPEGLWGAIFASVCNTPLGAASAKGILHPKGNLQFPGIQSINATHRFAISLTVPESARSVSTGPERIAALGDSKPFFMTVQGTEDEPCDYLRYAGIVSVDMWLPDEVLLANFKRWLHAARKHTSQNHKPRLFTHDDFARWFDDSYIKYWMLRFWAEHEHVEISQPVMVEILFPSRRSVTVDQFRKTKIPNYEKWLNCETLDTLRAQVELEKLAEEIHS